MNVLIAGAGRLGTQIAHVLSAARNEVTLIDIDDDRVDDLRGRVAVRLVAGDACEPALLEDSGVLTADLVIAATGDDEDNLVISLLAKRQFSAPRVAARVNDAENTWLFDGRWGVDVAVPAATPLISLIEEATGATDTVALLRLSKGCR
ncbi:NAD-binding protein [Streptomyces brasiliscabiei]|uniref:NAD-binding protein n=1 Tax=Streptomyces brasiliscabiei TaxID=2736302 RepID=A0ABU8GN99_9ACTN